MDKPNAAMAAHAAGGVEPVRIFGIRGRVILK